VGELVKGCKERSDHIAISSYAGCAARVRRSACDRGGRWQARSFAMCSWLTPYSLQGQRTHQSSLTAKVSQ
jgi:hypothetical protein